MEVKCCTCGKSFEKSSYRIARTKTGLHYCSRECYQENPIITQERTGGEIECIVCGSIVYRSGAQLLRNNSGRYYCSKACAGVDRRTTGANTVCDFCGKPFWKHPSKLLKSDSNYCSRDCWKAGIRSSGPPFYRSFKKDVCSRCGFIPEDKCQLDVHHADSDKKNNSEDNLLTLCANCHRLIHKIARVSRDTTTSSGELACSGGQCEL